MNLFGSNSSTCFSSVRSLDERLWAIPSRLGANNPRNLSAPRASVVRRICHATSTWLLFRWLLFSVLLFR